MAKQPKRGSWMRDSGDPSNSGKRLKPRVPSGIGVENQESPGIQRQAEVEVGGAVAVVATAATMDEPQVTLTFGVSRFHCIACLGPIKPPTFKCEAGHVVCGICRAGHAMACNRAATYAACPEVDKIVGDAKLPCPYSGYGCKSFPVYYQAADHERACQWAPCYCPVLDCEAYTSPARLVDHFREAHAWPVTEVIYGKPCELAMPPPQQGMHVLVGKDDRRVFLLSASALAAAAVAVSVVCLRANGDAAPGVPQFKCKLWVESRRNTGDMTMAMFTLASKDMSGGFVAAEQGSFLAVAPDLRHDASGETSVFRIRIDKASGGASAARSPTPPASSSGRQP